MVGVNGEGVDAAHVGPYNVHQSIDCGVLVDVDGGRGSDFADEIDG